MKKRFVSIILALVMILSLCACGNAASEQPAAKSEEPAEEAASIEVADTAELSDTDKQLALIYSQLDKLQQQSADLP